MKRPEVKGNIPFSTAALAVLENRSGQGGGCQSSGEEETSSHCRGLLKLFDDKRKWLSMLNENEIPTRADITSYM